MAAVVVPNKTNGNQEKVNQFLVVAVEILLVVLILFLLPPLVV